MSEFIISLFTVYCIVLHHGIKFHKCTFSLVIITNDKILHFLLARLKIETATNVLFLIQCKYLFRFTTFLKNLQNAI